MSGLLIWVFTSLFFGVTGGIIAQKDGWPVAVGVLVGFLFNFIGIVFLLGVWGAEWFVAKANKFGGTAS